MNESLERFIKAQESTYENAYQEIKSGRKTSHWIWYIFPQLKGLGMSYASEFYGINGYQEAKEYLDNEVLRNRLIEISNALYSLNTNRIGEVLPTPDDMKVKSSMTLFEAVDPTIEVFGSILDKYYDGQRDEVTLLLLNSELERKGRALK